MIDPADWHDDAECAKPENSKYIDNFFANKPSQQYPALKICSACPISDICGKWALENKQIWGIWGGMTPKRIRRTLSVNWEGQEMRHKRFPLCPKCDSKTSSLFTKSVDRPVKGRWATMKMVECRDCGFSWQSRTSANAVEAYYSQQSKKQQTDNIED